MNKNRRLCINPVYSYLIFICLQFQVCLSDGAALKGDASNDGMINGQDALKIMRVVKGLDAFTPALLEAGDVHPFPGVNGNFIGDGQLTREDAQKILDYSIGLIPYGDISGNYNTSQPVIEEFEPFSGPVGTEVVLTGANFIAALPGDNQLFFGDVPAEILDIAYNRITTKVPEGASTSLIRLTTIGGSAISQGAFEVTVPGFGILDLGGAVNPRDYLILDTYGADVPDADGRFEIPLLSQGLTILQAIPWSEEDYSYYSLQIVEESKTASGKVKLRVVDDSARISAESTAKTLVFLHPFYLTKNIDRAKALWALMDGVPEVDELASVIAVRYPQGAKGLDDAAVQEAWMKAVAAVLDNLPDSFVQSLSHGDEIAITQRAKKSWSVNQSVFQRNVQTQAIPTASGQDSNTVRIISLDSDFISCRFNASDSTLYCGLDKEPENGTKVTKACPADWMVTLYNVYPNSFPYGLNEPVADMLQRKIEYIDQKESTVVFADQWTAKIDIVYTLVDKIVNWALGYVTPPADELPLSIDEEGVYLLHAYSGAFVDKGRTPYDFQAIKNIPDGKDKAIAALVINLTIAVVDGWDLVTGESQRATRAAIKKGAQNITRKLSQIYSNTDLQELGTLKACGIMFELVWEFAKAAATATPQQLAIWGQEEIAKKIKDQLGIELKQVERNMLKGKLRLQFDFLKGLETGNKLLTYLDKISSFGRIVERLNALIGNPADFSFFPAVTPLESYLILVGDPFSPKVESISPNPAVEGATVEIDGDHFAPITENNTVYFENQHHKIQVKVIESIGYTRLRVVVPPGLTDYDPYAIRIETPAGQSVAEKKFYYHALPTILSLSPTFGYPGGMADPNGPYAGFQGSRITLQGSNLQKTNLDREDKLYLGAERAPIFEQSFSQLVVQIPNLTPGVVQFYFKNPETGKERNFTPFTVYGKPLVIDVSPTNPAPGEFIHVKGENFTSAQFYLNDQILTPIQQTHTTALLQMPSLGKEGDIFRLKVFNPAGTAETQEGIAGPIYVERKPGYIVPELTPLPEGYILPVRAYKENQERDGKISIDEAAAFSRGDLDLLSWDDKNEKWVHNVFERARETGKDGEGKPIVEYYWEESSIDKTILESSNGLTQHEKREHYFIRTSHLDHGGTVTGPDYGYEEDLDDGPENMEEADYIYSNNSNLNPTGYSGKNYRETILVEDDASSFHSSYLEMGEQDELIMPESSTLVLGGDLIPHNGNQYRLGKVKCVKPLITMNAVSRTAFHSGSFSNTGFQINQGFGNSLSLRLERAPSHGIFLQGGGGNQITADIADVSGDGIHAESSEAFRFVGTINRCGGDGIYLKGGSGHQITESYLKSTIISEVRNGIQLQSTDRTSIMYYVLIQSCTESGIIINGGSNHQIDASVQYNGGNGLELENVRLCSIEIVSRFNQGDGLRLYNHCVDNYIDDSFMLNNCNGIHLEGEQTNGNLFTECIVGLEWDAEMSGYIPSGNHENGILLDQGAIGNHFEKCEIYASGKHGVLIEGSATALNEFVDCCAGSFYDLRTIPGSLNSRGEEKNSWGNGLDGFHFRDRANGNRLKRCYSGQNWRNGISLTEEASFNQIEECLIGTEIDDADLPVSPNKEWGIQISDEALGNTIHKTTLGVNRMGGLLVQNLSGTFDNGSPLLLVDELSVGWSYLAYWRYSFPKSIPLTGTSGPGIRVDQAMNLNFNRIYIQEHDAGLILQGENTNHNTFKNIESKNSLGNGVQIIGVGMQTFEQTYVSNSESDGILILNARDQHFLKGGSSSSSRKGCGLSLDNCQVIQFERMNFGPDCGLHGIQVLNSAVVLFLNCIFDSNQKHGVYLGENARQIEIQGGSAQYNGHDGVRLEKAHDIQLIGDDQGSSLRVKTNQGNAISILQSKQAQIGQEGKGLDISGENGYGILIQGADTQDVQIRANHVFNCQTHEAIRIEQGRQILVGGFTAADGNRIDQNARDGIVVEGDQTQVEIQNNLIGNIIEWGEPDPALGNETGIVLQEQVQGIRIHDNQITGNRKDGIWIQHSAHNNTVFENLISYNGMNGIHIQGTETRYNLLSHNQIFENDDNAIYLEGGNDSIEPPQITKLLWQSDNISGRAKGPRGSYIEVYADSEDEGQIFIGRERLLGDTFSVSGSIPSSMNTTALIIHPDGNTSELSKASIEEEAGLPQFLYTYQDRNQKNILYRLQNQSKSWVLLSRETDSFSPIFSPQRDRVLFVSGATGKTNLALSDLYGWNVNDVTFDPAAEYDPDWGGDGSRILYVSEKDGNPEIYSMPVKALTSNSDGTIAHFKGESAYEYYQNAGDSFGAYFTADPGTLKEIRFYIRNEPAPFLWKLFNWNDGSPGEIVLAEGKAEPQEPGWCSIPLDGFANPSDFFVAATFLTDGVPKFGVAPSGDWTQYRRQYSWDPKWWDDYDAIMIECQLDVESLQPTRLTDHASFDLQPAFSPNGNKIAFASNRDGTMDIWVMDADGKNPKRLTDSMGENVKPAWSPDGKKIAFVSTREENTDIYMMEADGANLERLTTNSSIDTDPVWTGLNNQILFSSNRQGGFEIYSIRAGSSVPRRLTFSVGDCFEPHAAMTLAVNTMDANAIAQTMQTNVIAQSESIHASPRVHEDFLLTLSSATGKAGETISLNLTYQSTSAIGNLGFDLFYDPDALDLLNALPFDPDSLDLLAQNPYLFPSHRNPYRWGIVKSEGIHEPNLLQLHFKIVELTEAGEYPILIKPSGIYDPLLNPFSVRHENGRILVITDTTKVQDWMMF